VTAIVLRGDARRLPLPDGCVDLICTSPPYFSLRSYVDAGQHYDGQIGSEVTPAEWLTAMTDCTREWMRVLKPSGSLFVNLGDSFSSGQRLDSEFTVEDGAWLGGVIDSDGSISIHKQGTSYTAWVRVGQMRPEVVERIRSVTGIGTVCKDKRGCWHWQAAAQQASAVLGRIWPWLHIKRRQAFAAVELQGRKATVGGKGRWNALTDDELQYRERIRQAVLTWNAGEPDDYAPPLLPLPDLPPRARWIPAKSLMGLPWRYALACMDDLGLILRRDIIWSKPNGLPESVTDRCRSSHEYLFHFTRQPRYYAAVDEIREEHAPKTLAHRGGGLSHGAGANHYTTETLAQHGNHRGAGEPKVRRPDPLGKLPGSVWSIPSQPLTVPVALGVDHFAAFPMELPRRCVLGWSPPGVCTACGEGRRPVASAVALDMSRPQARRAQALADQAGLTEAHLQALLSVGVSDTGRGAATQNGTGKNTSEVYALASVARAALGGYAREYLLRRPTGFSYACACPQPDAPTRPALVLDPFGGTGTTALVAAAYGRTGISVDMSGDYSRLARWRTTDPGERAKAMMVAKPPPVPDGQVSLFDMEAS